jgi:hydrogenase maturation protease
MSHLYIPEIDKKIELFGKSRGAEMAEAAGAPLMAQIPIDPDLARLCDEGNIERYDGGIVARLSEALGEIDSISLRDAGND